jgi:hypothetical protein
MRIGSARELKVYQAAYALAMEIFMLSKSWPHEEKYSLTGQVRRSSRAVCVNLREAWAKRRGDCRQVGAMLGGMLHDPIGKKEVEGLNPPPLSRLRSMCSAA